MKAEPTKEQKELFSKLTPILGVNSKAVRYFDEDETNNIYIIAPILPIKMSFFIALWG